ncbi:hypothetical protein FOA52_000386 [Chlamydomonas sp. UWO 241]|nr:hypothetical protein FOA52_000386 [Chlamydomonas sp. UWO 241]
MVRPKLGKYGAQGLSNVLWALSTGRRTPEAGWLAEAAGAVIAPRTLFALTPQGLSQVLAALVAMRFDPSSTPGFTQKVSRRLQALLPSCNASDAAMLLHATAALPLAGPGMGRSTLLALLGVASDKARGMDPSHLAKVAWALARLQLPQSSLFWSLLYRLLRGVYRTLPSFNARDLAMLAWGLARLRCRLPEAFTTPLVDRVQALASDFAPQEVANTLWALARLGVTPSPTLLTHFFESTEHRLSEYKPVELAQMVWALGQRRCELQKKWVNELLQVSLIRLPEFTPWGLSTLVWGLSRLRISPPPAWQYSYVNTARAHLGGGRLSGADVRSMLTCLQALNVDHSLDKVDAFCSELAAALAQAGAEAGAGGEAGAQEGGSSSSSNGSSGAPPPLLPQSQRPHVPSSSDAQQAQQAQQQAQQQQAQQQQAQSRVEVILQGQLGADVTGALGGLALVSPTLEQVAGQARQAGSAKTPEAG